MQQSVELLKARIFDKQGRDPILTQLNRAIERVKTEGELLRKLLRSYPSWGLGHVRLGLWELKLHELCDRPLDPRSAATVRLSADAAELLSKVNPSGRVWLEAQYLRARLLLVERRYEEAVTVFETILIPAAAVQLSKAVHDLALEYCGASLMILGRKTEAFAVLSQIAENSRTAQVKQSLSLLQTLAQAETTDQER